MKTGINQTFCSIYTISTVRTFLTGKIKKNNKIKLV